MIPRRKKSALDPAEVSFCKLWQDPKVLDNSWGFEGLKFFQSSKWRKKWGWMSRWESSIFFQYHWLSLKNLNNHWHRGSFRPSSVCPFFSTCSIATVRSRGHVSAPYLLKVWRVAFQKASWDFDGFHVRIGRNPMNSLERKPRTSSTGLIKICAPTILISKTFNPQKPLNPYIRKPW